MSQCKYCQKEITWVKSGRKSVPVEHDGSFHECKEFTKAKKSLKNIDPSEISPEEITQYEKAMNQSLKKRS